MFKKSLLIMLFVALMAPWAVGQTLDDYLFSTGTDANKWVTLTDPTTILSTSVGSGTADSKYSAVTNIGFDFPFGENVYSKFSVNSDGNLKLGNSATSSSAYSTPFNSSNSNTNNPKINAFGCDGYLTANHYVNYKLVEEGHLIVEFCLGTYASSTRDNLYLYQIHLYSAGNIEIVFPTASGIPATAPADSHQCGLCVNSSDGWVITSSNNGATHFTNGSTTTNASGTWFDANRYYRFVRPVITCPKPTLSNDVTTTATTAIITWTPSSESQTLFDIYWSTNNTAPDEETTPSASNQSGTSYTINNLTSTTTYYVWLRGNCGTAAEPNIDGGWTSAVSFATQCGTINAGYSNNFDTESTGLGKLPQCWSRPSGTSTTYPFVINSPSNTYSGSNALYYSGNTSTTAQIAVLPEVGRTLNGLRLSFYAKASTASLSNTISVGYMTDKDDKNTFVEVATLAPAASYQTEAYTVDFSSYTGDPRFIAIRSNLTSYVGIYMDDVVLSEIPDCDKPTGLTSSAGSDPIHSVNLSWTSSASSWDLSYSTTSGDPDHGTIIENIENNPYTLTGLTGGVTYYAYVRANCTSGESEWSVVRSFTTDNGCGTPTSLSATAIPGGATLSWNDGDNTPVAWQVAYSTSYGSTPPANSIIVDVTTNPYTLSGLSYSTSYYSWVRTVCDDNDGTSAWSSYRYFTTLAEFPAPTITSTSPTPDGAVVTWSKGYAETQWQIQLGVYESSSWSWNYTIVDEILDEQTYTFTELDEQTTYRVQVRAYIDAEHQSSWSSYGTFTTLSSCPAPSSLNYSNLTATSVVLDWTKGYQETAWNIQYKANGAADWTLIENITDKPYTMTVTDGTNYQVQIQNACGSDWSNTITFDTPCLPTTAPFAEDFNTLTSGIPSCWNNTDGTTTYEAYRWNYYATGHDGACVRFNSYYNSNNNTNFLKTPVMNFPAGKTMVLGFWWKNPTGGDFSVYISTDGGATYTTSLKTGMTGQSDWKEEEIELTGYVGSENVVVVFKGTSNDGSGDAYIYLDDVTISEKNDCVKPKDLAVDSYDNHSATLSWDANGGESPWQVAYSTTENFDLNDPTAYSTATATTNPFPLGGLTNLTTYYVRVRTQCGENTYSEWNNNGYQNFTTTATYTAPTSVAYSDVTDESAVITWTKGDAEEDNTDYTVWYKTGDTELTKDVENATSTTLTDLEAGSNYEVKVRAKNGDDISEWSSSVEFQTEFCDPSNQCNISYTLTDSDGDGWNGGSYIKVVYKATNIDIAHLTLASGSSTTGNLALCDGAIYDFIWIKGGSFDYECGFVIRDVNNEIILEHSSGTAPTNNQLLLTYTMDCTVDACARPTDLTCTEVHPDKATLSWTETGEATEWQIAYSTTENFDLDDASQYDIEDADSNPFELTGLDANTTYYTYVRAVCDAENNVYSKWSATVCEFTTQMACPAPTNVHLTSRPASNQMTIAWTAGYEETDWNFYYKVSGEEWGSPIAVTATSYTITGELSTTYEVKVAAVCSGTEGGMSDVLTVSTPINVTTSTSFTEDFAGTTCPTGWTTIADGNYYHWSFYDEAYSSSYTTNGIYLITPLLYLEDVTPQISFDQKKKKYSSYTTNAIISVLVSTTGTDAEDFTAVWTGSTSELTTSYVKKTLSLSEYANQAVYIAFKYINCYYYWYIDNVEVSIANTFRTAGDWNVAANWSGDVPSSSDNVIVAAAANVPSNTTATANNITLGTGGSLTIADGGQLYCTNPVQATVKKAISHWTGDKAEKADSDGWYAISSPIDDIEISSFVPVAPYKWNVYRYDEPTAYWNEYRSDNTVEPHLDGFDKLDLGRGYLYRSTLDGDIEFEGAVNAADITYPLSFAYDGIAQIKGFNLVGNPFTHEISLSDMTFVNAFAYGFYLLEETGDNKGKWSISTTKVAPMQAFLVQATGEDASIAIANNVPTVGKGTNYANDNIMFMVKNSEYSDEAYVLFKKGHGLNKIDHRNAEIPMLYVINNGEEFAIADMPDNTSVINLGFEAKTMGQYTISLKAEGQYSYMHLYDKLTGEDIDMLVEDSYTFIGSQNDRKDRFVLNLNYNAAGIDSESDIFAYQNGSDIIVNGEGELQVIDITGRKVMTTTVNGVEIIRGLNSGVYIFRVIGETQRTQKIVVR